MIVERFGIPVICVCNSSQNCTLSEAWKDRDGSCAVIRPNVELIGLASGPRSTGSLSALNESTRNFVLIVSPIWKDLFSEKSHRRCESRRTLPNRSGKVRTLLASWTVLRLSKTSVLNQRSALRWSDGSTSLVDSPLMMMLPHPIGWPLCRCHAPLICHPPATRSSALGMCEPKWRPLPNGSSQIPLPVIRCPRSMSDSDSYGFGSAGFRNVMASIAFDQVYDICRVKPLLKRFSMRDCSE